MLNGEKFSTARVEVRWRKSESVVVDDLNELKCSSDARVFLIPQEPKVDKVGIKTAIKAGHDIPGCRLVGRLNMSIK